MESVNKKVIFITLILTIITSLLIYFYITKSTSKPQDVVEYTDVPVAAKTLPAKYQITDADIKLVKLDKRLVSSKAVTNKGDIVGKRVKESILADEQIIPERLLDENKATLSFTMPKGMRAISISVSEPVIVSNLIRPGDHVDIIASFETESMDNETTVTIFPRITKIILQNVQILAMGQDTTITDEKIKESPATVTLAVTPQDAEKLVYASEYATLKMILRHVEDDAPVKTDGVNRQDVATTKGTYTVPKKQGP